MKGHHFSITAENPTNAESRTLFTVEKLDLEPSRDCTMLSQNITHKYCEEKNPGCIPVGSKDILFDPRYDSNFPPNDVNCRLLWICTLVESFEPACMDGFDGFSLAYAVALESQQRFANNTLYPILVVNQLGSSRIESFLSKFGTRKQVKIVSWNRLTFQDYLLSKLNLSLSNLERSGTAGVFMRLDLPSIIAEHKLFELPEVCPDYALYTDSDVMFVNSITKRDISKLLSQFQDNDRVMAYGHQVSPRSGPINSGVIVMHVPRFKQLWPEILMRSRKYVFSNDQEILIQFFRRSRKDKLALLSLRWNFKVYWPASLVSSLREIKLIHFHGLKPGSGYPSLKALVKCDMRDINSTQSTNPNTQLMHIGICCNQLGSLAKWIFDIYNSLRRFVIKEGFVCM
jgi:hypothetical protein